MVSRHLTILPDLAVHSPIPRLCESESSSLIQVGSLDQSVGVHINSCFSISIMAEEDTIGEVEADAAVVDEKDKQRSQQNKAMNAMTDTVRTMSGSGQGSGDRVPLLMH